MPLVKERASEKEGVLEAAKMMLVSARTAPKTGGVDDVLAGLVDGDGVESLAKAMDDIGDERDIDGFHRDAQNVRDSDAVVLIGVRGSKKYNRYRLTCRVLLLGQIPRRIMKSLTGRRMWTLRLRLRGRLNERKTEHFLTRSDS
jgi:hypothetical protein